MTGLTCPPLGTGSVDMNALHEAAKKAKTQDDLIAAAEKATTRVEPEAKADAPAPAEPDAAPGAAA